MRNKATIIGLLLMFIGGGALMAQGGKPTKAQREKRQEKMKAMKKAFIKIELELTESEEQAFWPVYDKYEAKRMEQRKEHRALRKKYKGKTPEEMTDAEAEEILSKEIKFKEQKLALEKAYNDELKKVIPVRKVLMLHRAERKFKKQLLERMKKGRGPNGGRGPSGPGGPRGERGPGPGMEPPHEFED